MPSKTRKNGSEVAEMAPEKAPEPAKSIYDDLFTWHPPSEAQKEAYGKLQMAFLAVLEVGKRVVREQEYTQRAPQASFDDFTGACKGYALLIEELCPSSADRTAAIRCLRLARNAMNDILCGARHFPHGISQEPFMVIFETELIKCRYQANASIALGGRA